MLHYLNFSQRCGKFLEKMQLFEGAGCSREQEEEEKQYLGGCHLKLIFSLRIFSLKLLPPTQQAIKHI